MPKENQLLEPAVPPDEANRLAALRGLNILDTPAEERFDRLTRLAQRLLDVPIAVVSLVDSNRQWFKSCLGLDASETPAASRSAATPSSTIRFSKYLMHYSIHALPITRW